MSNQEHDPINEAHASLDQLSRVAISAVLEMAELRARREAERARHQRDEQVAVTKAMGAQLEADYSTKAVAPSAEGATLAGAVANEAVPAWQAASDERWWGSATADDLGRAWAAANPEAESGDPGAEKALAEMRRNVQEHWGLAVDQGGTVVDLTGPQAGPAVDGGLSGGRDDQGAADAVGAG